jgi:hypothetical protein
VLEKQTLGKFLLTEAALIAAKKSINIKKIYYRNYEERFNDRMYLSLFSYCNSSLTSVLQVHPRKCSVSVSLCIPCYRTGANCGQDLNTPLKERTFFLIILCDSHIDLIFMKFTKCNGGTRWPSC